MFAGCSNLNYIKVHFTDWNSSNNSTSNWLQNVASTGTFIKSSSLTVPQRNSSYVPSGWTINNI